MPIENTNALAAACESIDGTIRIRVIRGKNQLDCFVNPVYDGAYARLGMWVRDSTAGIGTFSFYDMRTLRFGALGHAVTDIDIGDMLRIGKGEICLSEIIGVHAGTYGTPGELRGSFGYNQNGIGDIVSNTQFGIFGTIHTGMSNPLYPDGVMLAYPDEVKLGKATFLSTVDASTVQEFGCEIVKLYDQADPDTKGMVVQITDEALLERTGGIVQGMSGSPILQNGKLVGIITHVFVNDPARGYGVFAYWMYQGMQ